jgi:hypothetical protein
MVDEEINECKSGIYSYNLNVAKNMQLKVWESHLTNVRSMNYENVIEFFFYFFTKMEILK